MLTSLHGKFTFGRLECSNIYIYIHIEVIEQVKKQITKVHRATSKALVKAGTAASFNVPSAFKRTEIDS